MLTPSVFPQTPCGAYPAYDSAALERPPVGVVLEFSVDRAAEVVGGAGEQDIVGLATAALEGVRGAPTGVAERTRRAGRGSAPIGLGAGDQAVDVRGSGFGGDHHRASPLPIAASIGPRPESGVVGLARQRPTH